MIDLHNSYENQSTMVPFVPDDSVIFSLDLSLAIGIGVGLIAMAVVITKEYYKK